MLPARSPFPPSVEEEAVLVRQVEEFQDNGFTVVRGVLGQREVAQVRMKLDVRMAMKLGRTLGELNGRPATGEEIAKAGHTVSIGGPSDSELIGFPGLLSAAPEVSELLIKPFLLDPLLLDLAEHVMGPFVQGDGFYVVGTPPPQVTGGATGVASRPQLLEEAQGWHRDAAPLCVPSRHPVLGTAASRRELDGALGATALQVSTRSPCSGTARITRAPPRRASQVCDRRGWRQHAAATARPGHVRPRDANLGEPGGCPEPLA